MTTASFPEIVPHFDDDGAPKSLPMDIYFAEQRQHRPPSDRSPSLTPMDKLLESLPPLPSTKQTSVDSFHAIPTMYSIPPTPPATKKPSEPSSVFLPSPANSFPDSSPSSNILLCKIEPEKKVSNMDMQFEALKALKQSHQEMKM